MPSSASANRSIADDLGDGSPDERREREVGREERPVRTDDEAADRRMFERREESTLARLLQRGPLEDVGDVVEDRRGPVDDALVIVGGVGVDAQPRERAVGLADPHRLVVHLDALVQRELRRLGLDRPRRTVGVHGVPQRVGRRGPEGIVCDAEDLRRGVVPLDDATSQVVGQHSVREHVQHEPRWIRNREVGDRAHRLNVGGRGTRLDLVGRNTCRMRAHTAVITRADVERPRPDDVGRSRCHLDRSGDRSR